MSVYMVIAEMASMYETAYSLRQIVPVLILPRSAPIAGGQYFWVSMLAPKGYKRFASYITGWLTSLAWVAVLATGSIFVGTIIQGLIILNNPSYESQAWHGTMLCWAVITVAVFINTVVSGLLPIIEGLILVFHVLGFVAVLIPLLYLSPHGSSASVFQTSLNEGGWPTQGISYCVGFIGNVATFVGADAAVHVNGIRVPRLIFTTDFAQMSEEIDNAAVNVPRAIFTTMLLNGSTGFAMILAVLFCLGDVDAVINTPTGFPFIQVFSDGTRSKAGATVMASLVVGLLWCAVIGFLATASRMMWSFARDRGVPFHQYISKVEPRTHIPMVAVALVTTLPCLLALIYIGSSTVFEDVVSMSTSGLYASYFIPCSLLLWRRTTGQIRPHLSAPSEGDETDGQHTAAAQAIGISISEDIIAAADSDVAQPLLMWGPWRIPGVLGIINNAFACLYILFVLFWSFWPPKTPATPENMNYSVLVTGCVVLFSIVYYFVFGKSQYMGPLIEHQVRGFARKGSVERF
ncbi:MAG: hypothetical protein Q9224_001398 [Gallowayella concinna]